MSASRPLGDAPAPASPSAVSVTLVSTASRLAAARDTVASCRAVGLSDIHVLDVDGSWLTEGSVDVRTLADLAMDAGTFRTRVAAVGLDAAADAAHADLVRQVGARTTLCVRAGVLLTALPAPLLEASSSHDAAVLSRTDEPWPHDGRWPDEDALDAHGPLHDALFAVTDRAEHFLSTWARSWQRPGRPWLTAAASRARTAVVGSRVLVGGWDVCATDRFSEQDGTLLLDGGVVHAVDLTTLDPARPMLLRARHDAPPRALLSEHPALASVVASAAARRRDAPAAQPAWDPTRLVDGEDVDDTVRAAWSAALLSDGPPPPDPFSCAPAELDDWLLRPPAPGRPGRLLATLLRVRPDLASAFPNVPGESLPAFLDWARTYGPGETVAPRRLARAVTQVTLPAEVPAAERSHGINLVGYLDGELGIGESARLVRTALEAAGIPTLAVPVDRHLVSPRRTAPVGAADGRLFDTTLLCVNADLTRSIGQSVPHVVRHGRRVGMWYWEVESFPPEMAAAADDLDEVWVATSFIRDAIAPHVTVPVRVVPPPLPQAVAEAPGASRTDLGLPEGVPLVLFSFDYLSTVERKNPRGALSAFRAAFPRGQGPVLVLKTLNAERRPADAEALRLEVAEEPDVVLLEGHLPPADRDALVRGCDVYLSLHRAEGLGLTMAEAMAWGKPVVATSYGGNVEFMDDSNSFLVPWSWTHVPASARPYPAGSRWADPDLDAAAALLRSVVEDPAEAARRAARGADDVRTLHSPQAVAPTWSAAWEGLPTTPRRVATSGAAPSTRLRATVSRWARRS